MKLSLFVGRGWYVIVFPPFGCEYGGGYRREYAAAVNSAVIL